MKTRVSQVKPGTWRCLYELPYSGILYADFPTWEQAYADACHVEATRFWY